jgi:acyl-CoA reductase-like NAD-dependent aldehyde dehydrogenase
LQIGYIFEIEASRAELCRGRLAPLNRNRNTPSHEPGDGDELDRVPLSPAADIDAAAQAAARAFPAWRRIPVTDRVQYLFKLKTLLEEHFDDLARTITMEAARRWSNPAARCGARSRTSMWPAARRS